MNVVVIGGGLAGITAALDCAESGCSVTLIETRPRLGGAAYSFEREGLQVDNGQHVFLRCCTAYRDLLRRLGSEDGVALQTRLAIPVLGPGGRRAWLRRKALPAPLHLGGSLARYGFLSPRERLSVALAMQALRSVDPDDPANDRRSFGDWLAQRRQSPGAVHALWELIVRPTVNLLPAQASLAQVAQVFRTGLLEEADAGDVGWATQPLSSIHDAPARRALAGAGVDVRLRWRAESVLPAGGGRLRIEVGAQPTLFADAVIVAVPHNRAARLLPVGALAGRGLEALGLSPIVNLHVVYDRPVLDLPFAAGVGTPVQWVFDRSAGAGLREGQYLAVSLSAADDEAATSIDGLRARYLPALGELLPGARTAHVRSFFVTREHAATFRAAPGARAHRPGSRTQIPGLLLAGSWTDTGWPATMEGAVRSGHAAAAAVAELGSGSARAPMREAVVA